MEYEQYFQIRMWLLLLL